MERFAIYNTVNPNHILSANFQKDILTTFVKMTTTKRVKRASKKRENHDFLEIEKIFEKKKGVNYEIMAKSQFSLNSDVYFSKK